MQFPERVTEFVFVILIVLQLYSLPVSSGDAAHALRFQPMQHFLLFIRQSFSKDIQVSFQDLSSPSFRLGWYPRGRMPERWQL